MKYGVSSYVWVSPFSNATLDQLEHAKKIGFDVYEIGVEDPDSFSPELVKKKADEVGIAVHICGAFGTERDISSENPEYRKRGKEYIRRLIDMAEIVGSPYVAGPMYAATGRTRLATEEEKLAQRKWAVENLRELCAYAKKKGVKLALETLNRFETDFLNTVAQGNALIDEVGMDNLGFLLDTFHMNIEEKDIPAAIRAAGNRLYDFHACANDRGTPGEDHLDWTGIRQALKDIQYDGTMVIESFTTDITEIAKAVSLWRPLAESQDALAENGLEFLKQGWTL